MLERWLALAARVGDQLRRDVAHAVFDDLLARYTAAERGYHDIRHVEACLGHLDSVRSLARQPDAVEFAIWFHDAVCDSRRSDNEEASACLAADALARLAVPASMVKVVRDLILATSHNAPPADADAALLADIDLSILGQPASIFDEYEAGIRFEYAWVSEQAFNAGRSKVLQSFLDRPRIYSIGHFHEALEPTARQNLTRSLAKLSAAHLSGAG